MLVEGTSLAALIGLQHITNGTLAFIVPRPKFVVVSVFVFESHMSFSMVELKFSVGVSHFVNINFLANGTPTNMCVCESVTQSESTSMSKLPQVSTKCV